MAGHRRGTGRPARSQQHSLHQRERMALAQTPAEQLDAAFDWFRSSVTRLGRSRGGSAAAQERVTREAITYLARQADAIDKGEIR